MAKLYFVKCKVCGLFEISRETYNDFTCCTNCGDMNAVVIVNEGPEFNYSLKNRPAFDTWYLSITDWITQTAKLATGVISEEANQQLTVMDELSIALVYIGKMRADVQFYLDQAIGTKSEEVIKAFPGASPTQTKDVVKGRVATEQAAFNSIERLGATVTHRIEALRSNVSYQKALVGLTPK